MREARVARGLELGDVAQTLKLGLRQVEAVEADAWDSLPGQTFIRGFVRNYARLVQIDSAVLMAQLDEVLVITSYSIHYTKLYEFTAVIGVFGADFIWENGMAYSTLTTFGMDVGDRYEGPITPDLEWPTWVVYAAVSYNFV